jgi:hypothetical protein
VFLEGIWQQAQRGFLHGAFTGVWVRRFLGVGLLVFLCQCDACGRGKRDESYESTGFQDATREWLRRVMAIVIKRPHHIIHVTPMQRAIPGDWYEFLGTCANTDISASCSLASPGVVAPHHVVFAVLASREGLADPCHWLNSHGQELSQALSRQAGLS